MTPETKKTLIYGGVISFAVGAGLYIWSRYQGGGTGDGGASAQAAAQAQANADAAAASQETQLAELAQLSGGATGGLPTVSLGNEAPPDNFAHEIAQILQAAGLGVPATGTAPPPSSNPTAGLPQPSPPATPVDGNPAVKAIPVTAQPGGARTFDHILADMPNYPTTIQ